MNLHEVKRILIGGRAVKQLSYNNVIVWRLPSGIQIPLVQGEWTSYGISVAVDATGIITLDGTAAVSNAAFIRITGSYEAAISSTGMADTDPEHVFVPAGTSIRFGIERIEGSYTQVSNSMNIVLRDAGNVVQFNCKLGDDMWSQEGVASANISCLSLYIKRGVVFTSLRIRPYIELL